MSVAGGRRARKDHTTTLFYGGGSDDAGLWIQRDPKPGARHGSMTLRLGFVDVAQQLAELGHDDLAARLSRTIDPAEDARVVREALTIALAQ